MPDSLLTSMPFASFAKTADQPVGCGQLQDSWHLAGLLRPLVWGVMLLLGTAGCTPNPAVEFTPRTSTTLLAPNARQAVEHTLLTHFGTPDNLVVWDRLSVIDFGGAKATVESLDAKASSSAKAVMVVTFGNQSDLAKNLRVGAPVRWVSGAREGIQGDRVAAFDAATRQVSIALEGKAASATAEESQEETSSSSKPVGEIAAGDAVVIDDGGLLAQGRVVYQRNCMHCHGSTGDGKGPTAKYMQPPPRDYRDGIFKFTSTQAAERITRDDLMRILDDGIPGTYMPSFLLMDPTEKKAVIEYVRWLSIRGEMEKRITDDLGDFSTKDLKAEYTQSEAAYQAALNKGEKAEPPAPITPAVDALQKDFAEFFETDYQGVVEDTADFLVSAWERAETPESVITPAKARVSDDATSRERGRLLYLSDKTKCYTCHGAQGRGDGPANFEYWKMPSGDGNYPRPGLHDLWGNLLPARDLTRGIYRGGRRPVDLYRRLYAGIKGTPMPAFGGVTLTDDEIWDLVNYVLSVEFTANGTSLSDAESSIKKLPATDEAQVQETKSEKTTSADPASPAS
ncbi:Cytochrome c [Planctopirus ephydatiae]|uniref:Cytochrome c n=1 Tax=Planctopirus ephydatiae TaxID=2528019 RepID=A0A518GT54_9PLAN|nr:cytochrome c [Planctopirus ephydatiae]QDV31771.1 Cytochrome c [Planctopirus ephydatiae]